MTTNTDNLTFSDARATFAKAARAYATACKGEKAKRGALKASLESLFAIGDNAQIGDAIADVASPLAYGEDHQIAAYKVIKTTCQTIGKASHRKVAFKANDAELRKQGRVKVVVSDSATTSATGKADHISVQAVSEANKTAPASSEEPGTVERASEAREDYRMGLEDVAKACNGLSSNARAALVAAMLNDLSEADFTKVEKAVKEERAQRIKAAKAAA